MALKSVGRKYKRWGATRAAAGYSTLGNSPTPARPSMDAVPELESSPESPARADGKPPRPRTSKLEGNAARLALVALLCAIAVAEVESLDKLVALIGGCLGIPLAFIFPLAIHLRVVDDASRATRMLNRVAMGVGLVLCLACTGVTIATW